ncbi:MAG: SMC-Scp complex subunit ScpB [Patescibacteria group bacterium]|nr:SMC-Scp complex subunit ScpB [Patescibacteria group bacterium]
MSLKSQIESLLFITNRPLSLKDFKNSLKIDETKINQSLHELSQEYEENDRGLRLLNNNSQWQLVTHNNNSQLVNDFLKEEMTSELTWPSIETLSILAYRGPIDKLELDQIRGVNCSLILRNLMIKGLAEEVTENKQVKYQISFDFLKYLGVNKVENLPDFEQLHNDENLLKLIQEGLNSNS